MAEENKNKEGSKLVDILSSLSIVVISFFLFPIILALMLYFFNDDFNRMSTYALSNAPGSIGERFTSKIERENREKEMMNTLAKNYLEALSNQEITNNLLEIKEEDANLYEDLLSEIKKENNIRYNNIKELIDLETRDEGDKLSSLMVDMEAKELERMEAMLDELDDYSDFELIKEVMDSYSNDELSEDELAFLLNNLDARRGNLIYNYLDLKDNEDLLAKVDNSVINEFEKLNKSESDRLDELKIISERLNRITEQKAAEDIINNNYSSEDLAVIFNKMDFDDINQKANKVGKILSKIDNEEYINDLYKSFNDKIRFNELYNDNNNDLLEISSVDNYRQVYIEWDEKVDTIANNYINGNTNELINYIDFLIRTDEDLLIRNIEGSQLVFNNDDMIIGIYERLDNETQNQVLEGLEFRRRQQLKALLINI